MAAAALLALFRMHGAPLVLKTDNGSHLVGGPVATLLQHWNVTLLRTRRALIECGYLNTRRTVNSSAQSNASLSEN